MERNFAYKSNYEYVIFIKKITVNFFLDKPKGRFPTKTV